MVLRFETITSRFRECCQPSQQAFLQHTSPPRHGVALSGIHTIENIRRNYELISVIESVLGIFELKLKI
jgi:hypothetical protein